MKQRLDNRLVQLDLLTTRSQAESYIKLGMVTVDGKVELKPGRMVSSESTIKIGQQERYVSRAGLKLASVAGKLNLNFTNKIVLDVGSSTGGFTDYALQHGAQKVIAVDVGTDQLHPSLQGNPKIELHEKTDIRHFQTDKIIDMVVADVSFISLREVLPAIAQLSSMKTEIVAMVKPQFEARQSAVRHKGVIKNDKMRRDILKDFETWARQHFIVLDKADSEVAGSKGNQERFYLLRKA
jgi:23S rRNA (cytidine1920-2'-O)/16S rRNA (cytidine1409-2'-O)-methyltransferase